MGFDFGRLQDAIDEVFEGRKGSEKIIFFVMPLLVFGFLSYKFIIPISEKKIASKKSALASVQSEISDAKEFLKRKNEVIQETSMIKDTNKLMSIKLQKQIAQNEQVTNSMQGIDFIHLNDKNVADFMEYLTIYAAKHGVTIVKLQTSIAEKESGIFKQELSVGMELNGAFRGILGFVGAVENSEMFTTVSDLNISHGEKLNAKLNVKVSGI